jgi:hypothetical protein
MQPIRVLGEVDDQHRLLATVPDSVPPGSVEVVVIARQPEEDDAGENWMAGIAREWHAELSDPREDIYTLEDGEPN